jgi:anti-sigma factor RsiW
MTTCRDLSNFLLDYVGGDLSQQVRAEFEAHIARCPDCHIFLAQYERTITVSHAAYDEVQTDPLPNDLVNAIVKALQKA